MNEAAIKESLTELYRTVSRSSQPLGAPVAGDGIYISTPVEKPSIEQALEVLGLHLKYVMFDLEATRRENKYLRQMLESRPKSEGPDGAK